MTKTVLFTGLLLALAFVVHSVRAGAKGNYAREEDSICAGIVIFLMTLLATAVVAYLEALVGR